MGKVIQGLGLAAVLALGGIVWRIIVIREAEESMQQMVLAASQQQQAFLEQQQQRQQEQQQRQLALQAQERERQTLSQDQRCVGGTVITVRGTVYSQEVGADGRAVHCTGNLAAVPLR